MSRNGTYNASVIYAIGILKEKDSGLLYVVPVLIGLLALLGNSLIVAAYIKYKNLRDSTTSFVINLGVTDLLTGLFLLTAIVLSAMELQLHNQFVCLALFRTTTYLTLVSQALILVTTFERYMGICQRDNYSKVMTTHARISLITCAWLLPLPLSIIPFFGYNEWENVGCTLPIVLPKWLLLSRTLLIFLQTIIVMAMYSKILIKARQINQKLQPAPLQGLNAFTARSRSIKRSVRNGKVIGLVTMLFFASWLPNQIVLLCYCIGDVEVGRGISDSTKLLGLSNSIVNPFLYAWQKRDMRKRLKQMLRCIGTSHVENQGMQIDGGARREVPVAVSNMKLFSARQELQELHTQNTQSHGTRISESTHHPNATSSTALEVIEL